MDWQNISFQVFGVVLSLWGIFILKDQYLKLKQDLKDREESD